jgi:hypothetical protein
MAPRIVHPHQLVERIEPSFWGSIIIMAGTPEQLVSAGAITPSMIPTGGRFRSILTEYGDRAYLRRRAHGSVGDRDVSWR